jgi:hypothetical protein
MHHTKRLLLIPEDIYQNLAPSQDGTPINLIRSRIKQIENSNEINEDEKAAKYHQEYKRLNKIAKDEEERPVDVRLQNFQEIADALLKPVKAVPAKPMARRKIKRARDMRHETNEDEEWEDADDSPPKTQSQQPGTFTGVAHSYPMTKVSMMEYIQQNAASLGVNREGKMLKSDNTPYRTSKIEDIVSYLLDKDSRSQFRNFPVGYKEFAEKAKEHEILKKYLFPEKPNQYGKGNLTQFKKHKKKNNTMFLFKPKLW